MLGFIGPYKSVRRGPVVTQFKHMSNLGKAVSG